MKWKRITWMSFGILGLTAAHALAATSGWPVDGSVTSITNFFSTTVANGLFNAGAVGCGAHMVAGLEWGRAANTCVGAMGGGSIITNANGIATVSAISPGATIRLLQHPVVHHFVRHLIG